MGWVTITNPETGESTLLGDANQYRKYQGLSHYRGKKFVSENDLQKMDEVDEPK